MLLDALESCMERRVRCASRSEDAQTDAVSSLDFELESPIEPHGVTAALMRLEPVLGVRWTRLSASLCLAERAQARASCATRCPGWELELLDADEYPPEDGRHVLRERAGEGALRPRRWRRARGCSARTRGSRSTALGGGPGVRSARWAAGSEAERALEELRGVEGEGRRARYVCELVAIAPDGEEHRGTGILEGRIADEPRGTEGFGFDPVFVPDGEEQTVAELGDAWKASTRTAPARRARSLGASTQAARRPSARPPVAAPRASHQLTSAPKTITFAIT